MGNGQEFNKFTDKKGRKFIWTQRVVMSGPHRYVEEKHDMWLFKSRCHIMTRYGSNPKLTHGDATHSCGNQVV